MLLMICPLPWLVSVPSLSRMMPGRMFRFGFIILGLTGGERSQRSKHQGGSMKRCRETLAGASIKVAVQEGNAWAGAVFLGCCDLQWI